jgi:glycerol kinase
LGKVGASGKDIVAIGITNQRETAVVWDKQPDALYNAIVWQCTRTDTICNDLWKKEGGQDRFRKKTGLPIATYFAGPKIKWILDNVPEARRAADKGQALFGTIETWIIWQLTGGTARGRPCHRCHQCQPDPADGPEDPGMGCRYPENPGNSPANAAAHRAVH